MSWLPHWLAQYQRAFFRRDIVAGITLAAYLIPSGLADASLANLPPEAGLYACIFSGLLFWVFCSSKHTAITVTSGISLLVGSSIGEIAGGDPSRFAALAACTALLVGALSLVAWLLKAGVVVNFVSETVLIGFKFGIALVLISTQLPKLFGFSGTHGDFWERMHYFYQHVHQTNLPALMVGVTSIMLLVAGKILLPNRPVALVVMIIGISASSLLELAQYGVRMLDAVPSGLPSIGIPQISVADVNELLPLAMACFLLGAVETVAIGRMFALKHGYRFEPNREFLALAAANIAAGLGRGFPVGGGMSQSLVNESGGARTPLSGLVAALFTMLAALFLSEVIRELPQPVLAAIVLMAVTGLMKFKALKELWHFSREEFFVAITALVGVLGSGILRGVLIGAVLSLIILIRKASRPQTVELGRVPNTTYFADIFRHPENIREPEVFVFRSEGALLYFNADYVRDRFVELLNSHGGQIKLAVYYLGMVPIVDLAGIEMLTELQRSLRKRGIELRLAEARGQMREALRRGGLEATYGQIIANQTVDNVITEWRALSTQE